MDDRLLNELLALTKVNDLPDSMQPVAELIGMDNLLKLSKYVSGSEIYIPIPETLVRKARNAKILEEYNGYNAKVLAKKYGITEDMIKKIVHGYEPTQYSIYDLFDKDGQLKN